MRFLSIRARDFRNFRDTRVEFSPRLNMLLGENGQGKTNLLEAMYFLTQGDSFRAGGNETLLREGTNEAFLEAQIERKDLDYVLKSRLQKTQKVTALNDKRITSMEARKLFPVVLFSPESLAAIKEGADARRELIDDFLIMHHPQNADLISEYRKALKSRNRVLRQLSEGDAPSSSRDVLESLNPRFLQLAAQLTEARSKAVRDVQEDLTNALKYVSTKSDVDILVEMSVSGQKATDWSRSDIDHALQQRAVELRDAEVSSGVSLVGPHKHEINFVYHQKDSRFYCSQGQQRAIILSFKMAQIVYHRKTHGFYPVLMLDDVLSELDAAKRKALIAFLHEINTQVFLTTTDLNLPDVFQLEDSAVMHVSAGQVQGST